MKKLILSHSDEAQQAIADATKRAVESLSSAFPGESFDMLEVRLRRSIETLLKGRDPMARSYAGEQGPLPAVIADSAVFGSPLHRGNAFLLINQSVRDAYTALPANADAFCALDEVTQAWDTYDEAAQAAFKYCLNNGISLEAIDKNRLVILPVVKRQSHSAGFLPAV